MTSEHSKDGCPRPLGQALDRRAKPRGVFRRAHPHARLPRRRRPAGWPIPTARSVPWAMAAQEDGRFKSHRDLVDVYLTKQGFAPGEDVITYCRIGERSSHTWFVMKYLLGFDNVKNYDGSWTEWGSAVRVPIVTGDQPGEAPLRASVCPTQHYPRRSTRFGKTSSPSRSDRLQLLLEFSDSPPGSSGGTR